MATFWETASHSDGLHICSLSILTYCQLLSSLILGRDFKALIASAPGHCLYFILTHPGLN